MGSVQLRIVNPEESGATAKALLRIGFAVAATDEDVDGFLVIVGKDGTGIDEIRGLRGDPQWVRTPILALVPEGDDELDVRVLHAGANDIAVGPIDDVQLEYALRRTIGLSRRISQNSEADQERKRRKEALGRLAGGVANDLNNLLTVIVNHTRFAQSALPTGSAAGRDLDAALAAANTAAALVEKLLAFSRKRQARPKVIDLNETLNTLEPAIRRKLSGGITLEYELQEGLWSTKFDPGLLQQVLFEMVENAVDAMPSGGVLTLTTSVVLVDLSDAEPDETAEWGSYVTITIQDTGVGMPEAVRSRVFEPFFSTKGTSNGLGLASAYGIVKQAGGFTRVRSEEGVGTTFTLHLLPTSQRPVTATPPPTAPTAPAGQTVLIAEDNEALRNVVARLLRVAGYKVVTAASGQEALDVFKGLTAERLILLTDVVMPNIGGVELATRLRALKPQLPVLFMSGFADYEPDDGDLPMQDERFLAKPFEPNELLEALATLQGPQG